ncbi:MAG: tRNA (adenine-N1)-methyltransferase [Armatimonadota bacterium]|nr:tRNA (adenine-N1)-methyltransferase [Armatimonadota bacterium]MDR7447632.1 tRNA (adenine-N1)-methyltransferase [Armatimonadota bacterium]MDR7459487.1 tRNA (adenine-N1)-methyltransferase [Armatimonadota bacterium]MDR7480069.1 tRNA (adenine-N1)-methyltransferase [Armatimonadota bacterium]MDR7488800.1 tRNA (adenine-N1)-methyltransferase [Armatimonadota bacterium]
MGAPAREAAGSGGLTGPAGGAASPGQAEAPGGLRPGGPLQPGEPVLLVDRKGRRYLITLTPGRVHDLRGGRIPHDALLGREEGVLVETSLGERVRVLRPTLAEFVLEMPRAATVIYPKDLGVILVWGDLYPGARVVEAGTGSGALTMALLRAVGPTGRVASYEVRPDFARQAARNIARFLGPTPALVLREHDITAGIPDAPADRVVLDLPEPWRVAGHAAQALRPGGIWLSYVPTVPQVQQTVEALRATGAFVGVETVEVLLRGWNVEGPSVRPAHRMVAHTGFITVARRIAHPGAGAAPGAGTNGAGEGGEPWPAWKPRR